VPVSVHHFARLVRVEDPGGLFATDAFTWVIGTGNGAIGRGSAYYREGDKLRASTRSPCPRQSDAPRIRAPAFARKSGT